MPAKKTATRKTATTKKPAAKKPAAKKTATKKTATKKTATKKSAAKKTATKKSATKKTATKKTAAKKTAAKKTATKKTSSSSSKKPVKLLSGGNPQIAKADGDAPVQQWIDGLPDQWKIDSARWLDKLIEKTVPGVQKKVRWNSPMYGVEGQGLFLGFHAFKSYIKINFFFGALLEPKPPVGSADKNARYLHLEEGEKPEEAQVKSWIKQAAALPGWGGG